MACFERLGNGFIFTSSFLCWLCFIAATIFFCYLYTIHNTKPVTMNIVAIIVMLIIFVLFIGLGVTPILSRHMVFLTINSVILILGLAFFSSFFYICWFKRSLLYGILAKYWNHDTFKFSFWVQQKLQCCGFTNVNTSIICSPKFQQCDVILEKSIKKMEWNILLMVGTIVLLILIGSFFAVYGSCVSCRQNQIAPAPEKDPERYRRRRSNASGKPLSHNKQSSKAAQSSKIIPKPFIFEEEEEDEEEEPPQRRHSNASGRRLSHRKRSSKAVQSSKIIPKPFIFEEDDEEEEKKNKKAKHMKEEENEEEEEEEKKKKRRNGKKSFKSVQSSKLIPKAFVFDEEEEEQDAPRRRKSNASGRHINHRKPSSRIVQSSKLIPKAYMLDEEEEDDIEIEIEDERKHEGKRQRKKV